MQKWFKSQNGANRVVGFAPICSPEAVIFSHIWSYEALEVLEKRKLGVWLPQARHGVSCPARNDRFAICGLPVTTRYYLLLVDTTRYTSVEGLKR